MRTALKLFQIGYARSLSTRIRRCRDHVSAACVIKFIEKTILLGFEGIVSKRLGSPYVSGRTRHWLKFKNPAAPAVKREVQEDWR